MPKLSIAAVRGRVLDLELRNLENQRPKPDGVKAANLFTHIGDNPPTDLKQWQFEGGTTKSDPQIVFAESVAAGTVVWVTALWINPTLQPGPACGAMMESRVILPLPPEVNWDDATPVVLPGAERREQEQKLLEAKVEEVALREKAAKKAQRKGEKRQDAETPRRQEEGGGEQGWGFAPERVVQALAARVPHLIEGKADIWRDGLRVRKQGTGAEGMIVADDGEQGRSIRLAFRGGSADDRNSLYEQVCGGLEALAHRGVRVGHRRLLGEAGMGLMEGVRWPAAGLERATEPKEKQRVEPPRQNDAPAPEESDNTLDHSPSDEQDKSQPSSPPSCTLSGLNDQERILLEALGELNGKEVYPTMDAWARQAGYRRDWVRKWKADRQPMLWWERDGVSNRGWVLTDLGKKLYTELPGE